MSESSKPVPRESSRASTAPNASAPKFQAETLNRLADVIEQRVVPALERIAAALETRTSPSASAVSQEGESRWKTIEELRRALASSRWEAAERLVEQSERDFPDSAESLALRAEFEATRERTIVDLRSRLAASRDVNDPEMVITLHDDLAAILKGEAKQELQGEIVRWLLMLIQRRLRTGTVRSDVVDLASRVAERFGGTTEGASLRASLPMLRRSAGLCPRCGGPYAGIEDACPRCLTAAGQQVGGDSANPWAIDDGDEGEARGDTAEALDLLD